MSYWESSAPATQSSRHQSQGGWTALDEIGSRTRSESPALSDGSTGLSGPSGRGGARSAEDYLDKLDSSSKLLSGIPLFSFDIDADSVLKNSQKPQETPAPSIAKSPTKTVKRLPSSLPLACDAPQTPALPKKPAIPLTLTPVPKQPAHPAKASKPALALRPAPVHQLRPKVSFHLEPPAKKVKVAAPRQFVGNRKRDLNRTRTRLSSEPVAPKARTKVMIPRQTKVESEMETQVVLEYNQAGPSGLPEGRLDSIDALWLAHWRWFEKERLNV